MLTGMSVSGHLANDLCFHLAETKGGRKGVPVPM